MKIIASTTTTATTTPAVIPTLLAVGEKKTDFCECFCPYKLNEPDMALIGSNSAAHSERARDHLLEQRLGIELRPKIIDAIRKNAASATYKHNHLIVLFTMTT